MQLENSFTVPAPPAEAWKVLLDVERVAPCMPGATLTDHDGDTFGGTVKVKVGPIALTYRGTASFTEKDEATHKVVIDAKGRETRGSGTATAKISCTLMPDGEGTRVDVLTDMAVTGRPAQFGRGVIGEVAGKVITQFADALSEEISAGTPATEAPEAPATSATGAAATDAAATGDAAKAAVPPTPPSTAIRPPEVPRERRSADSIDLLDVAGAPVAKRLAPVAVVALLVLLIAILRRRSSD